jgi:hypothetical protein
MMEAGAYWGAYRPVLAALQVSATACPSSYLLLPLLLAPHISSPFSLTGCGPLEMMEAGAYWGAYRPFLAALQVNAAAS